VAEVLSKLRKSVYDKWAVTNEGSTKLSGNGVWQQSSFQ
jgi:hypothetical protein